MKLDQLTHALYTLAGDFHSAQTLADINLAGRRLQEIVRAIHPDIPAFQPSPEQAKAPDA